MTFYENQHRARRNTSLLVTYFLVAVILIVVAVNLTAYVTLFMTGGARFSLAGWFGSAACWWIALFTVGLIGLGSLFRMAQLSKGGLAVALMAGGVPLDPATRDLKERTLINVTEEMAIASGTRVPRIFVLRNEQGINAFVAGTDPNNTVLAVTQGTLDALTREELQGVIGHEFSHILNGDMGINVRLIGILAGILLIGQIGEFLLRGQRRTVVASRNRKGQAQMAMLGMALMAIGYVGLFFGRLIKAAISRQREFLADASSVQFTRNPDGIAGALYAIGQHSGHSLLQGPHAEDMSHMCFGETLKINLKGLLSTHPPVEERIKAIDPALLPRLKARFRQRAASGSTNTAVAVDSTGAAGFAGADAPVAVAESALATGDAGEAVQQATEIKSSVGSPLSAHADYAHRLYQSIPARLLKAAHDPLDAEAVLYALLLTEMRSHRDEAKQLLGNRAGPACLQVTVTLYADLKQANPAIRLALLDIALPTLKPRDDSARAYLIESVQQLINMDQRVTLSEFICVYLIRQALNPPARPARTIKSFQSIESSLALLFSAMVQSSGESAEAQGRNFRQIMASFSRADFGAFLQLAPTPKQLTHALDQLNRLTPLLKQPVIDTCVDCVLHDARATLRELELLRAVSEALECPMPPIMVADSV